MKQYQTGLLLCLVVALMGFPLWMVKAPEPGPDGKEVEIFSGADTQAKDLIGTIAPDYKPWVKPLMEPPSGEVETCLFALQSAIGAAFIGYYFGVFVTRSKMRRELEQQGKC